jgi:hypothetical protein
MRPIIEFFSSENYALNFFPQVANSYEDDDIQEVVPVKSEPGALVPDSHSDTPTAERYGGDGGGSGQLSDPAAMDYGDEYGDYEGAYDNDDGSYDDAGGTGLDQSLGGSGGGADGNKGRKKSD